MGINLLASPEVNSYSLKMVFSAAFEGNLPLQAKQHFSELLTLSRPYTALEN